MDQILASDDILKNMVLRLKEYFKPEKIYLFGSRARGTSHPDSDYDLFLIIKNSDKQMIDRNREARSLLWGRTVSVDIFVYTIEEFNEAKNEINTVAHAAFTEGVEF